MFWARAAESTSQSRLRAASRRHHHLLPHRALGIPLQEPLRARRRIVAPAHPREGHDREKLSLLGERAGLQCGGARDDGTGVRPKELAQLAKLGDLTRELVALAA